MKKLIKRHQNGGVAGFIKDLVSLPSDLFKGRSNPLFISSENESIYTPFGNASRKVVIDKNNNMYEDILIQPSTGMAPNVGLKKMPRLLHGVNGKRYTLLPNGHVQEVVEKQYMPFFEMTDAEAAIQKAYKRLERLPKKRFSEGSFTQIFKGK